MTSPPPVSRCSSLPCPARAHALPAATPRSGRSVVRVGVGGSGGGQGQAPAIRPRAAAGRSCPAAPRRRAAGCGRDLPGRRPGVRPHPASPDRTSKGWFGRFFHYVCRTAGRLARRTALARVCLLRQRSHTPARGRRVRSRSVWSLSCRSPTCPGARRDTTAAQPRQNSCLERNETALRRLIWMMAACACTQNQKRARVTTCHRRRATREVWCAALALATYAA